MSGSAYIGASRGVPRRTLLVIALLALALGLAVAAGCTVSAKPASWATDGTPASGGTGTAAPAQAWDKFRAALKNKDDDAVYASLADNLRAILSYSPTGAAQKVAGMLPQDLDTLQPKQLSGETWMVDPKEDGNRVEFASVDGTWRVKTISSAVVSHVTENFTPDPLVHRTVHLPKGAKVVMANSTGGRRTQDYRVKTVNGVAQPPEKVGIPTILTGGEPGTIWLGTGTTYHGPAKISGLRVGTSHNQYGISKKLTLLTATKVISIGFELSHLPSGSGVRAVLLDADGVENVGDAAGAGSGIGWTYTWKSGTNQTPGGYAAVIEVDSKPAAWRPFWVK